MLTPLTADTCCLSCLPALTTARSPTCLPTCLLNHPPAREPALAAYLLACLPASLTAVFCHAGISAHQVSASEGSGAESADDAPESSHDLPVDSSNESDLEHQGLVSPSNTQQQQQQQGMVKQEDPTVKQQQGDDGVQGRSKSDVKSDAAPLSPPHKQLLLQANSKQQAQLQGVCKHQQQQQQAKGKGKRQAPLKREELGCAAARAWVSIHPGRGLLWLVVSRLTATHAAYVEASTLQLCDTQGAE